MLRVHITLGTKGFFTRNRVLPTKVLFCKLRLRFSLPISLWLPPIPRDVDYRFLLYYLEGGQIVIRVRECLVRSVCGRAGLLNESLIA